MPISSQFINMNIRNLTKRSFEENDTGIQNAYLFVLGETDKIDEESEFHDLFGFIKKGLHARDSTGPVDMLILYYIRAFTLINLFEYSQANADFPLDDDWLMKAYDAVQETHRILIGCQSTDNQLVPAPVQGTDLCERLGACMTLLGLFVVLASFILDAFTLYSKLSQDHERKLDCPEGYLWRAHEPFMDRLGLDTVEDQDPETLYKIVLCTSSQLMILERVIFENIVILSISGACCQMLIQRAMRPEIDNRSNVIAPENAIYAVDILSRDFEAFCESALHHVLREQIELQLAEREQPSPRLQ